MMSNLSNQSGFYQNVTMKKATIPTPIPVWIQKSRLSTSPGSSLPMIFSTSGVAHA